MTEDENNLCVRLIQEYGDAIFRMCFLYLKDYHMAEDVTQEVFIKAMKNYASFGHLASEKTWLTRIAINCCKNVMRTKWFKIRPLRWEELNEAGAKLDFIDSFMIKDGIAEAILELKAEERKIIVLYYYQELSLKEIAYIVGGTENAASQRLSRARKKLKKILEEKGYDGYLYER